MADKPKKKPAAIKAAGKGRGKVKKDAPPKR